MDPPLLLLGAFSKDKVREEKSFYRVVRLNGYTMKIYFNWDKNLQLPKAISLSNRD